MTHAHSRLALPLAVTLMACHGNDASGPEAEYFYDCDNAPSGTTNFATDESFVAFINKEAANAVMKNDGAAAHLITPAAGATVSVAAPPEFNYQTALSRASFPPAKVDPGPAPARALRSFWARARRWLSPEGTANAHCGAVSGENALLRIKDGDTNVYTAMLSVAKFTPTATGWTKAMKGREGHTISVTIENAVLLKGEITSGPFTAPTPPTFMLGP